eukprot:CAMPEP_0204164334 /NCGR_PEP_ID=MMETSP0361-20130328/37199_1 /ASSEMBLY_ACC=CAM_ASM_000343 /TAXON_ID=268821 /ORGANISM="Scrippsiella Hangoei, Strain SHTV-5" /LENGTH=112 /DNA_ID=CAMNT_0051121179 /DNA_START=9 /DNA_END=347 /DNA_ORIENTATION=+
MAQAAPAAEMEPPPAEQEAAEKRLTVAARGLGNKQRLEKSADNKRVLHDLSFKNQKLALDAASAGNLQDDICVKVGGCCGSKPLQVAKSMGHTEVAKFLDDRKLYPPPLKFK